MRNVGRCGTVSANDRVGLEGYLRNIGSVPASRIRRSVGWVSVTAAPPPRREGLVGFSQGCATQGTINLRSCLKMRVVTNRGGEKKNALRRHAA